MASLSDIKHIVVLMLENRSFDNLFGFLRPAGANYDGLMGLPPKSIPAPGGTVETWTQPDVAANKTIPDPDPEELFVNMTAQLFNGADVNKPPPMTGFAMDYAKTGGDPKNIMHCFLPPDIPALSALANAFAVSDQWFASAPCQTWPNRFFVHAATSGGNVNNDIWNAPFMMQTVFNELDQIVPWRIYFNDFPQAFLLTRLWGRLSNFRWFDEFISDAAAGQLPAYSFIEPMYYATLTEMPNDMHPPHNVGFGDALVAKVYNAVRSSPCWPNTMLIITFDEHGGCYDHVPPPPATPPSVYSGNPDFNFNRFGVRVPTVVISPYTTPMVLRVPQGGTPFDHTSIIKTVRNCFGIGSSLTARDAVALDVSAALNASFDINRGPASLPVVEPQFTQADLQKVLNEPANDMQALMHAFATKVQPLLGADSVEGLLAGLVGLGAGTPGAAGAAPRPTVQTAGQDVKAFMQAVLDKFGQVEVQPPKQRGIYQGH